MSKQVTKKSLFVCLVISLVLIVAGAFMFGFLGFNADSTGSDYTVVQVSDFSFSIRSEETQQQLTDFCSEEISKTYSVSGVEQFTDTSTGEVLIRYTVEGASISGARRSARRSCWSSCSLTSPSASRSAWGSRPSSPPYTTWR